MSDKEGEKDADNESLSDWTLVNQEEANQDENNDEDLEESSEAAIGPPKEDEEQEDSEEDSESEEEEEGAAAVAAPVAKSGSIVEEIKVSSGAESSDIETLDYSGLEDYPDHYQIVYNKGTLLTLQNIQFHNYKTEYAVDADAESLSSTESPEEKVRKRRSRKPEATQDEETDLSLASSPSLPDDLPAIRPEPQYIHTPHQELNSRLNLIVALTLACVLGLGIGHFLGWSSRTLWEENLNAAQVRKLRELQDNLLSCMSSPSLTTHSEQPPLQHDPFMDNEPPPMSSPPTFSPLNCDSTDDDPVFTQPILRVPMTGRLNSKIFLNPLIDVLTEPLEDAGVIINIASSSENIINQLGMEDTQPVHRLHKEENDLFDNEDISSYFRQEYNKEELHEDFLKPQLKSSNDKADYIPIHKIILMNEEYIINAETSLHGRDIEDSVNEYGKVILEIEDPYNKFSEPLPLSSIPSDTYDDRYTQGYEIDYNINNIDGNDLVSNVLSYPKIIEQNNKNKHFEDIEMSNEHMETNTNDKFKSIEINSFQFRSESRDFYRASVQDDHSGSFMEDLEIFDSINDITADQDARDYSNINEFEYDSEEMAEMKSDKYIHHQSEKKLVADSVDKPSYTMHGVISQPKQLHNIAFISNELDNLNKKFDYVLQNLQKLSTLQQITSRDIGNIDGTKQYKASDYYYKDLFNKINIQNESYEGNKSEDEVTVNQRLYLFSTCEEDLSCSENPQYAYSSTPIELTPSLTLILELPKIISNLEVENEALQAQILTLQVSNLEPIKIKGKEGREARELRERITQLISDNEDMRLAIARVQYNSLPDSDRGSFNRVVQENHHFRTSVAKLKHLGPDLDKLKYSIELLEQENKELVASVAKIRYEQPMPRELKSVVKEMESVKQAVVTELQKKKPSSNLHSAKSYLVFMSQVLSAFNSFNDDEVGLIDKVDLARDVFSLVVPKGVKLPHLAQEKVVFGRSKFKEIKESLQTKWKQLKELTKPENIAEIGQSTLSKMNRVIVNVVNKIKDIAHMTILKQNKKPIDLVISTLADKINILDEQFDKTWKSLQTEVPLPQEDKEEIFGPDYDDEPADEENKDGEDDDDEDENMLLAGAKNNDKKETPNKSKIEDEEKLRDLEIKKHKLMREEAVKQKIEIKEKQRFEKEKEDFRKKTKKAVKEEISKNIKSVNKEEKKGKKLSGKKKELVDDPVKKNVDITGKKEDVKTFSKPQMKGKAEKNTERPKFHVKEVQKADEPEPDGRYFKGQYNKLSKLKLMPEEDSTDKKYFKRKEDEEEEEDDEDDEETEQTHHKNKHDMEGGGLKRLWEKPQNKKSSSAETNGTKKLFIKRRG